MMTCPNCKHEFDPPQSICPKCGYQIMSPEEFQKGFDELKKWDDKLKEFFHSSLDISPDGKAATRLYIDNVMKEMSSITSLLKAFSKKFEEASNSPNLFQNTEWKMNATMLLMGIVGIMNGLKNNNFSQEVLANPPDGCGSIYWELFKIKIASEELITQYGNLVDNNDLNGLIKSRECMSEISTRIKNANLEMEKISDLVK